MKRPKIGDIIEIETKFGLSYAQYTHHHHEYGYLIQVFDGKYLERPAGFEFLARLKVAITTFFPLGAAVNRGIVEIVSAGVVRKELEAFPLFRVRRKGLGANKPDAWALWNGDESSEFGPLREKDVPLPIRGIWNDTLLIKRIEDRWANR